METLDRILVESIEELTLKQSDIITFFGNYGLVFPKKELSLQQSLDELTTDDYEDIGIEKDKLLENLNDLLIDQEARETDDLGTVSTITIIGGHDKSGNTENAEIVLKAGTITSIVGPTGSGKSRLLADIEWMAQKDTPTGRTVLVNGKTADPKYRFSLEHKLVAQLSQNMNFVMDTSVFNFLLMHASSRSIEHPEKSALQIIEQGNLLAGEPFTEDTPVTALSGGQSRALMIADSAFLSTSPVVLIDEIENAGIDRRRALNLLVRREKIVLIATHDPILALMAERRIIIRNGGISKVLATSKKEKENLEKLQVLDDRLLSLRNCLREGGRLEEI